MSYKQTNNNEVIIIGGDHHNTLAVIRGLGKKKIPFIVLIHDDLKKIKDLKIFYSKYTKKIFVIQNNERSILNWLLNNVIVDKQQLIIPCSDLAEYTIDKNYKELAYSYIMPGFKNEPGLVCKLMDKYEQKKWANKNNIKMAQSWIIRKKENKFGVLNEISFPCIIKPNISAFGNKSDIKICNTTEEFKEKIKEFNESDYQELIIQKFLQKKYEICAIGCICDNKKHYGSIIKKIRENPPKGGGSLTFAQFIDNYDINLKVKFVIDKLIEEGYNGLYDIEFLVCEDDIYLNEINFRHSGNGYALLKSGINAPYIWCLGKRKENLLQKKEIKNKKIYFIDDLNELSLLSNKEISKKTFIIDFLKARAHSIILLRDMGVFIYVIKTLLRKRRSNNESK